MPDYPNLFGTMKPPPAPPSEEVMKRAKAEARKKQMLKERLKELQKSRREKEKKTKRKKGPNNKSRDRIGSTRALKGVL
jgi:hypothetical protein